MIRAGTTRTLYAFSRAVLSSLQLPDVQLTQHVLYATNAAWLDHRVDST